MALVSLQSMWHIKALIPKTVSILILALAYESIPQAHYTIISSNGQLHASRSKSNGTHRDLGIHKKSMYFIAGISIPDTHNTTV